MGYSSVEDFLVEFWDELFLTRDANNMLAQVWTWKSSDINDSETYGRDFLITLEVKPRLAWNIVHVTQ